MPPFRPRRVTLTANVAQAVTPPSACIGVEIGNATPDDLKVYEDPSDESSYFVIAAGYAKVLAALTPFDPLWPAFYLKASQNGTVVLIWMR